MNINRERLARLFTNLCEIDSPSKKERPVSVYLKEIFKEMRVEVIEDNSGAQTGSDSGNLLVRFDGAGLNHLAPVFFCCHTDTVLPAEGVKVIRDGDIFSSAGETVLGGDDKSGIAILIEVMRSLKENNVPHGPVELLFTTCEEIGLLGAKAFDYNLLQAETGYALDTTGTEQVIIGAPAANRINAEIQGIAAHAGLSPEKGINAIQLAAQAISSMKLGRLDEESTANIGLIEGGAATNIVPEKVLVKGEVRSHSPEKLAIYTDEIIDKFKAAVKNWTDPAGQAAGTPDIKITVNEEYPVMRLDRQAPVIKRVEEAGNRLGRDLEYIVAGGGSDANIFNSHGKSCAIIGTGMQKVHSTDECIDLNDMVRTAELVMAMLT